jgi:hypothetical protein
LISEDQMCHHHWGVWWRLDYALLGPAQGIYARVVSQGTGQQAAGSNTTLKALSQGASTGHGGGCAWLVCWRLAVYITTTHVPCEVQSAKPKGPNKPTNPKPKPIKLAVVGGLWSLVADLRWGVGKCTPPWRDKQKHETRAQRTNHKQPACLSNPTPNSHLVAPST